MRLLIIIIVALISACSHQLWRSYDRPSGANPERGMHFCTDVVKSPAPYTMGRYIGAWIGTHSTYCIQEYAHCERLTALYFCCTCVREDSGVHSLGRRKRRLVQSGEGVLRGWCNLPSKDWSQCLQQWPYLHASIPTLTMHRSFALSPFPWCVCSSVSLFASLFLLSVMSVPHLSL